MLRCRYRRYTYAIGITGRRPTHVFVKRSKMACPSVVARRLICAHAFCDSAIAFCSFLAKSRSLRRRAKSERYYEF